MQTTTIVIIRLDLAGSVSKATLEVKCPPRVFWKAIVEQTPQAG